MANLRVALVVLLLVAEAALATIPAPIRVSRSRSRRVRHCRAPAVNQTLVAACRKGDLAAMQSAVAEGASVDYDDNLPIISACTDGNFHDAVKWLIGNGADPAARDNEPLIRAVAISAVDVVELLAQQPGVDVRARRGLALSTAVHRQSSDMVKCLLDLGAVPDDNEGDALEIASRLGDLHIMELLLAKSPETLTDALWVAILREDKEMIEMLLDHGADPGFALWAAYIQLDPTNGKGVLKMLLDRIARSPNWGDDAEFLETLSAYPILGNLLQHRRLNMSGILHAIKVATSRPSTGLLDAIVKHLPLAGQTRVLEYAVQNGDRAVLESLIRNDIVPTLTMLKSLHANHGARVFDSILRAAVTSEKQKKALAVQSVGFGADLTALTDSEFAPINNDQHAVASILSSVSDHKALMSDALRKGRNMLAQALINHAADADEMRSIAAATAGTVGKVPDEKDASQGRKRTPRSPDRTIRFGKVSILQYDLSGGPVLVRRRSEEDAPGVPILGRL
ncbi:Ankyrin repeat domain-containing protein [Plasmodiophora brassicae]|uniref:Uncharacterized protein n=1 Tax=Plasmodiophora brassicae TaxID=37360 RepID=A0A0G4IHZ4_PLABS|nr:hypothetical protein PBRA_000481 [Plasmodiophora brassicae]SPQ93043.1 unnamed protein product [Plasmodiophora brassicae]